MPPLLPEILTPYVHDVFEHPAYCDAQRAVYYAWEHRQFAGVATGESLPPAMRRFIELAMNGHRIRSFHYRLDRGLPLPIEDLRLQVIEAYERTDMLRFTIGAPTDREILQSLNVHQRMALLTGAFSLKFADVLVSSQLDEREWVGDNLLTKAPILRSVQRSYQDMLRRWCTGRVGHV